MCFYSTAMAWRDDLDVVIKNQQRRCARFLRHEGAIARGCHARIAKATLCHEIGERRRGGHHGLAVYDDRAHLNPCSGRQVSAPTTACLDLIDLLHSPSTAKPQRPPATTNSEAVPSSI